MDSSLSIVDSRTTSLKFRVFRDALSRHSSMAFGNWMASEGLLSLASSIHGSSLVDRVAKRLRRIIYHERAAYEEKAELDKEVCTLYKQTPYIVNYITTPALVVTLPVPVLCRA
jgi:hypothetical protein